MIVTIFESGGLRTPPQPSKIRAGSSCGNAPRLKIAVCARSPATCGDKDGGAHGDQHARSPCARDGGPPAVTGAGMHTVIRRPIDRGLVVVSGSPIHDTFSLIDEAGLGFCAHERNVGVGRGRPDARRVAPWSHIGPPGGP